MTLVKNAIIDSHIHLWDIEAENNEWLFSPLNAPLQRSFGLDEFAQASSGTPVTGAVVVIANSSISETQSLLRDLAGRPLYLGLVGWIDLISGRVADQIALLREGSGGNQLVGVRHSVISESDPEWLRRDDVINGLKELAKAGLVFDLLISMEQIPVATDCARRVPDLKFVLDHVGNPRFEDASRSHWERSLSALAQEPNVSAKFSGLVTRAPRAVWIDGGLQPYFDIAFEAFGADRLMLGSDWPVSILSTGYREVIQTYESALGEFSALEQDRVRRGTADEVYGLSRIDCKGLAETIEEV